MGNYRPIWPWFCAVHMIVTHCLTDDPGNYSSMGCSYAQNAKILSRRVSSHHSPQPTTHSLSHLSNTLSNKTAALRKSCAPDIEMGKRARDFHLRRRSAELFNLTLWDLFSRLFGAQFSWTDRISCSRLIWRSEIRKDRWKRPERL